jgi:hypothetical protein
MKLNKKGEKKIGYYPCFAFFFPYYLLPFFPAFIFLLDFFLVAIIS